MFWVRIFPEVETVIMGDVFNAGLNVDHCVIKTSGFMCFEEKSRLGDESGPYNTNRATVTVDLFYKLFFYFLDYVIHLSRNNRDYIEWKLKQDYNCVWHIRFCPNKTWRKYCKLGHEGVMQTFNHEWRRCSDPLGSCLKPSGVTAILDITSRIR